MRRIESWLRCLVCSIVCIAIIFTGVDTVYAYDTSAPHEVNKYYQDAETIAKIQLSIWAEMRTWGVTEAGCAGVMGNMMQESRCDPTITQNKKPWERCKIWPVKKGNTGLGLTQWTYHTRQKALFDMADSMGKQWTDLGVQLAMLKSEITTDTYKILFESDDIDECCDYFLMEYERPGTPNYTTRRNFAHSMYEKFAGTTPSAYNGEFGSVDGTVGNTGENEVTEDIINAVTKEMELVGMSGFSSSMVAGQEAVELATRDGLSIGEEYSVVEIGSDLYLTREAMIIDKARVGVVFVGLCMVFYGVLLLMAMMLDKVNTFIEFSMVKFITCGFLQFTEEEDLKLSKGYASWGRMLCIIAVVFGIGCLLISGGVIPFLMGIVENFKGIFRF